jgi:hypothetical protein
MKYGHTSVVATFSDLDKAQEVTNRLAQAGIPAEVHDESKLQKYWFLSRPLAADKVMVDEKDFEKARSVLQAADVQDHVLHGELRCPQCGSANMEYPQFTRKLVITTALLDVLCLLHILDKEFYCRNCQHTWPASNALKHETDCLNWPKKNGRLVKKETV